MDFDPHKLSLCLSSSIRTAIAVASQYSMLYIFLPLVPILWYYLFYRPFDRYKDMTEAGYDEANSRRKGNDTVKMNYINELRAVRKRGEATSLYANGWYNVMESGFLAKNQVREASYFGLTLVIWRGNSGKAYIADGICPHLGAHLGVLGAVKGDCIECPFHGWTFEGEGGKCVRIPYADKIPESAKINLRISVEQNGFIFMWYHEHNEAPTWYPRKITEIESGEFAYRGRTVYRFSCHAQDFSENFADVVHFDKVHSVSYLAGDNINIKSKLHDFLLGVKWVGDFSTTKEEDDPHEAWSSIKVTRTVLGIKLHTMELISKLEGPGFNTTRLEMFGYKAILCLATTPVGPFETRFIMTLHTGLKISHPFCLLMLYAESIQLDRDSAIFNRKSRWQKNPILLKEDKKIKQHRNWYAQFYSKPLEDEPNNSVKSLDY